VSAVSGIINLDHRPVCAEELSSMAMPMLHRGPDGSAVWIEGAAGLGHLMLHTTMESLTETLPYKDPASSRVITADARLDNRSDLINKLQLQPGRAANLADSQLLLEAFNCWGDRCVEHLLGDFAFAIWDPAVKRLFCARDHFGKRPFYFYCSDHVFAFGSTVLAVANAPRVPKRINQDRVADFLVSELEGINNTVSFVKNVYRLPPANLGILENGQFRQHRYWQLDPEKEIRFRSDAEYADGLEEVLTAAVRANIRSHLPVAGMLSGGVDSSTVCAISRKLIREGKSGELITISGTSEIEDQCVESACIRKMQASLETRSISLKPSDIDNCIQALHEILAIAEDPFDFASTMNQMIYLTARQLGTRVVLDGLDGGGVAGLSTMYPSSLFRKGDIATAMKEIMGMRKHFYRVDHSFLKLIVQAARPAVTPDFLRRWKHNNWVGSRFDPIVRNSMISDQLAQRTQLAKRVREYRGQGGVELETDLRRLHVDRLEVPYLTAGIERYNRLAAIAGVEARSPLLDKRVVEFCLAMPWQQKWRDGWSKFALRFVLQRFAPFEIAWRPGWAEVGFPFWDYWQLRAPVAGIADLGKILETIAALNLMSKEFLVNQQSELSNFIPSERFVHVASLLNWAEETKLSWS